MNWGSVKRSEVIEGAANGTEVARCPRIRITEVPVGYVNSVILRSKDQGNAWHPWAREFIHPSTKIYEAPTICRALARGEVVAALSPPGAQRVQKKRQSGIQGGGKILVGNQGPGRNQGPGGW